MIEGVEDGAEAVSRRRFLGGLGVAVGVSAMAACRKGSRMVPAAAALTPSATKPTPSAARPPSRWPAEWEPHEATLMSMPHKAVIYGSAARLAQVQVEWAGVAKAIAAFEPLTMVVPPGEESFMRELLGPEIDLMRLPYDDGWLRDNGPIFVTDGTSRTGLDWRFNGWGGAFDKFGQTWHLDDRLPVPLCRELGIPSEPVDMVLEGGAVQSDGEGTIITTEECLLNPNRNPSMTKPDIESELLANFGAQKVIWLPYGLLGDLTSGHVDGVCMYIGPGRVLAQTAPESPKEQARLQANLEVLKSATDAKGRKLDVVQFPFLPVDSFAGLPVASSTYINFGFVNEGLVVPLTGVESYDTKGLGMLRDIITDRKIVGVPAPTINWAGGGVHCITQQLPAA